MGGRGNSFLRVWVLRFFNLLCCAWDSNYCWEVLSDASLLCTAHCSCLCHCTIYVVVPVYVLWCVGKGFLVSLIWLKSPVDPVDAFDVTKSSELDIQRYKSCNPSQTRIYSPCKSLVRNANKRNPECNPDSEERSIDLSENYMGNIYSKVHTTIIPPLFHPKQT